MPAWIHDWPAELGDDMVTDLLALHERLLTSAIGSLPNTLFVDAAAIIRQLIKLHTRMNPYDVEIDLRSETQAAATEVLYVLRHANRVAEHATFGALRAADGWVEHANLRVTVAETQARRQKDRSTTHSGRTIGRREVSPAR
ncbi:hypothetical protein ACFORH_43105 [Amycolatopsis roodepoortensis]|uniref:Uncharacterized protein n=1 Tax=Amycolatopsis roodepoortensis TaxID=700274 RepID=A0ABR9LJ14_9PSEU|nr:hypothetical protein [Amycolatopsis roodepoortensis]MBE1580470.1 hypothetical protein [Amycolatopsis roodepoortensis]